MAVKLAERKSSVYLDDGANVGAANGYGTSKVARFAADANHGTHSSDDAEAGIPRRDDIAIGVLAVQGAFIEHEHALSELGANVVELRQASDITEDLAGLVLPGGESTAQSLLLRDLGMLEPLRALITSGIPVLATCAGMILLATDVEGGGKPCFGTIPMTVLRNAYGRQLDSFHTNARLEGLADEPITAPMTFIRAPYVKEVGEGVEVLARVDGNIVAVRYGNQIALSFHPELDRSRTVHTAFVNLTKKYMETR